MIIPGLFILLTLLVIGITIASNLIFFPRLQAEESQKQPLISVLIPARDEAAVITQTVKQVLAQKYAALELIVLDDWSSDSTAELAIQAAGGDKRFLLLRGEPLPSGWPGKNWACHQLAMAARGEILLFLDADVQLQPAALAAAVAYLAREHAEMLTVWPTQITIRWSERLVVPLIAFVVLGYLPVLPVHYTAWPIFAAANGQCLLFTRSAYFQIGGHAAVCGNIVEDVALARRVKSVFHSAQTQNSEIAKSEALPKGAARKRNFFYSPLRMIDGNRLVFCHMYPGGWPQIRDGFAKNFLAGYGNSVLFLFASTIFHWLVFVIPWLWWMFGGSWFALSLGLIGIVLRAMTAIYSRQRVLDALWMPVSVVLMTRIAIQSIIWHYTGNTTWKGRQLGRED